MIQINYENVHFFVIKVKKDDYFVFWSTSRVNAHIFMVKNHLCTLKTLFWVALYISFSKNRTFLISLLVVLDSLWVTDFGYIYHYAGRICILWPMLGGGV